MNTFAVIILVCNVAVAGPDCDRSTARLVMAGPQVNNEVMCGVGGQARLATSGLVVQEDEYVKIVCQRTSIGRGNVG